MPSSRGSSQPKQILFLLLWSDLFLLEFTKLKTHKLRFGRWKAKVQKAAVFIHEPKDQAEECGPRTQRKSPRGQVKKRIKKQVKFTAVIHI